VLIDGALRCAEFYRIGNLELGDLGLTKFDLPEPIPGPGNFTVEPPEIRGYEKLRPDHRPESGEVAYNPTLQEPQVVEGIRRGG
jgi:hypothetical protein